jgi:hypothetical protein
MAIEPLYVGCDMDLAYLGARAALDNTYLNSGTCTYDITDQTGTSIGTGTLTYDAGSSGNYRGVIESTVTDTVTEDAYYTLTITFVQGGYNDERVINLIGAYRGQV